MLFRSTCRNHLSRLEVGGVSCVEHYFGTPYLIVFFHKDMFVYKLSFEEMGVARFVDLYLAHHLTNDDFEVFVVDFHTLQAVNVLNFVDDILLNGSRSLDSQYIGRCNDTVGERNARTDKVTFLNEYLFRKRNKILLLFSRLGSYRYFAVTAFDFTERYFSVYFGNDGRVARVACLEKLGYTRQTACDVACFTRWLDRKSVV